MKTTYHDILKQYWGFDDFRGIQREIIESICSGQDTLGLMPTGGGKSITFQVPAMAMDGTCIVITPLIALMKDQVSNLRKRGIRADAIYTGLSHEAILTTLENAVFGAVKLLYVSPERLSSELFLQKLRHIRVSFICVDEAHCISQWGYDFRPSYLKIADIRQQLPDTPVLALTATATPEVITDIQRRLAFRQERVFRMSFERRNLAYVVRHCEEKEEQMIHILNRVAGSAIVYVRSRQRTTDYAKILQEAGITATAYHAGLENATKDARQKDWQTDKIRVMVATNAFGMGIDKPDVRVVIHMDCPDSIEAYFQEAGRAGRDGNKAYAVLLYDKRDKMKLSRRVSETFPDKDYIRKIYDDLAYFYQIAVGDGYNTTFELPIERFCRTYKLFPVPMISALNILTRAGYVDFKEEEDIRARVKFQLERDDLYRLKSTTAEEERVIDELLRCYSGLFQDYQFIDESVIAQNLQLTKPQVYMTLRTLTQKHILHYIPEKHIPLIRFTQRREESERLIFSADIYDDLKARYQHRIQQMLAYADDDHVCRSRFLLNYFGETQSHDCQQCDVCLKHKQTDKDEKQHVRQRIMTLLADHQPHSLEQLHALSLPEPTATEVLTELLSEGILTHQNDQVRLAH